MHLGVNAKLCPIATLGGNPHDYSTCCLKAARRTEVFCTISAILLMIYLCDVLAPKRFGRFDHMQTLAIIIFVTGLQSLSHEVAAMSYQSSLEGAFGVLALAVILAAFMCLVR